MLPNACRKVADKETHDIWKYLFPHWTYRTWDQCCLFGGMWKSKLNNHVSGTAPSTRWDFVIKTAWMKESDVPLPQWTSLSSQAGICPWDSKAAFIQGFRRAQALGKERHLFVLCTWNKILFLLSAACPFLGLPHSHKECTSHIPEDEKRNAVKANLCFSGEEGRVRGGFIRLCDRERTVRLAKSPTANKIQCLTGRALSM